MEFSLIDRSVRKDATAYGYHEKHSSHSYGRQTTHMAYVLNNVFGNSVDVVIAKSDHGQGYNVTKEIQ